MEDNVAVVQCKAGRAKTVDYVIKVINWYLPNYSNNMLWVVALKTVKMIFQTHLLIVSLK